MVTRPARYRDVFAHGEFRVLFAGQALSVVGDQFARVALSILVFDRTASAGLTALTYALTYLPDLVSGPLLAGLADRYPRRRVMVVSDVLRCALVGAMAVPGLPLAVLAVLLVLVQAAGSPFNAARAATLAVALDGDRYVLGKGATDMVVQLAQVLGFAIGGTLVGGLGPGQALLADAASFAASALLVGFGVPARPRPADPAGTVHRWARQMLTGTLVVLRSPRLRSLVALACVAGCYITVEGLATPYARGIGGGPGAVGLLLAASPAGTVLGMLVVSRWRPETRLRWLGPLAVGACLPLVLCVLRPGLAVTVVLWALSGAASAYHLPASAAFVQAVPDHRRGQAFGVAATSLKASQGGGILLAGLAAEFAPATLVVAGAGAIGVVAALAASLAWLRAQRTPSTP